MGEGDAAARDEGEWQDELNAAQGERRGCRVSRQPAYGNLAGTVQKGILCTCAARILHCNLDGQWIKMLFDQCTVSAAHFCHVSTTQQGTCTAPAHRQPAVELLHQFLSTPAHKSAKPARTVSGLLNLPSVHSNTSWYKVLYTSSARIMASKGGTSCCASLDRVNPSSPQSSSTASMLPRNGLPSALQLASCLSRLARRSFMHLGCSVQVTWAPILSGHKGFEVGSRHKAAQGSGQ